jgi:hypothetical protein
VIRKLFWTSLQRVWLRWSEVLLIVKPETAVGWHRAGFRRYWRWRFQPHGGRPRISDEIRSLIHGMATENSNWGAPKIHGELLKLGVSVSQRTVARYLRHLQRRGDLGKRWLAFLANHREGDRRIRLFYGTHSQIQIAVLLLRDRAWAPQSSAFQLITRHATAEWVVQQLRETFPETDRNGYAILDHDSKFDGDVIAF